MMPNNNPKNSRLVVLPHIQKNYLTALGLLRILNLPPTQYKSIHNTVTTYHSYYKVQCYINVLGQSGKFWGYHDSN